MSTARATRERLDLDVPRAHLEYRSVIVTACACLALFGGFFGLGRLSSSGGGSRAQGPVSVQVESGGAAVPLRLSAAPAVELARYAGAGVRSGRAQTIATSNAARVVRAAQAATVPAPPAPLSSPPVAAVPQQAPQTPATEAEEPRSSTPSAVAPPTPRPPTAASPSAQPTHRSGGSTSFDSSG